MSVFKRLITRYKRGKVARATIAELSRLSNRELHDIGISRSEIAFVAKKNAYHRYR